MVGIAVELNHEPPVYPDQIDLGARATHRIDEPVEAEQCGKFGIIAKNRGKPLFNIAQRVRRAAPRGEPGFRADTFAGFRLGNGNSRVGVGDHAASAIEDTIERRVERRHPGEQGDHGGERVLRDPFQRMRQRGCARCIRRRAHIGD
jgi:hypothetical protein